MKQHLREKVLKGWAVRCGVPLAMGAVLANPLSAANEPKSVTSGRPVESRQVNTASTPDAHRRPVDRTSPNWQPSSEEESEAKLFLEKNCPRRYETVQRSRKDGKVPLPLVRSYFDLEALRTAEPDLYEMKVQQVQLEDKIFGLTEANRQKPTTQSSELRDKVHQLVVLRIAEHQKRLDKLRFVADVEEQKLNLLKNNTERAIDEELARQKANSERLARQNSPNGPGAKRDGTMNASPVPRTDE